MRNIKRDNTKLICDIGELGGLFRDSTSLETFLQRIVEMIADHMNSDVCSIYLYYLDTQELILSATHGLNKDFIGKLKLKLGEGLTGVALKELRPISERHASKNSSFRYFPGLGEEKYESFLAVPIIRGTTKIGTMVIQNTQKDYFSDEDTIALRAVTSQLANTIEMARLIMSFETQHDLQKETQPTEPLKFIQGKVGSEGFAFAQATILKNEKNLRLYIQNKIVQSYTLEDFEKAVALTEKQLEEFQRQIEEKLADVASLIFSAQILMLKDKGFIEAIVHLIEDGEDPVSATITVVDHYVRKFESLPNLYLREKSQDIRDIGKRLLDNLVGHGQQASEYEDHIIVSEELLPSDVLKFSSQKVRGIILLRGGTTSHVSILAQSLSIPLIIADHLDLLSLPAQTKILMDAEQGNIYINPAQEITNSFKGKEDLRKEVERLKSSMSATTETSDGTRVYLLANINLLGDVKNAREYKAEGVGLYRTEFPFIIRSDFPSEEEQYVIYKKLIDGIPDKEITLRTLDIGGDKVLSYFQHHIKENNPFLGMRSIRFSLQHLDIFSHQIRAILRAGADANIRIMFPMISSLDEFLDARKVVISCINDLKMAEVPCNENPKIGLMVELPSVVEIIEDLAQEADFFSIGTNDFIQYMLAVDRTNEKVSNLYLPHHPSILRSLKKIVDAANKFKKDVSICGDMAQEEKYLEYFLGIGLRKFSMTPAGLPKIQTALRQIKMATAKKNTEAILSKNTVNDIARMMKI